MLTLIPTYTSGTFILEPSIFPTLRHGLRSIPQLLPKRKQRRKKNKSISSAIASLLLLRLPRSPSLRLSPRRRKKSLLPNRLLSSRWRSTRQVSIFFLLQARSTPWKSMVWYGTRSPRSSRSPMEYKSFRLDALLKTIRSSLTISLIKSLPGKMMCNQLIWLACKNFDSLYCMTHLHSLIDD